MSKNGISKLVEFVNTLNDGVRFFHQATELIINQDQMKLFEKNLRIRGDLIKELKPYVVTQTGGLESGHANKEKNNLRYAQIITMIRAADSNWISKLEEIEDQSLEKITELMHDEEIIPVVRDILKVNHRKIRKCLDEMMRTEIATS